MSEWTRIDTEPPPIGEDVLIVGNYTKVPDGTGYWHDSLLGQWEGEKLPAWATHWCRTTEMPPPPPQHRIDKPEPGLLEACKDLVEWAIGAEEIIEELNVGRTHEEMAAAGDAAPEIMAAIAAIATAKQWRPEGTPSPKSLAPNP